MYYIWTKMFKDGKLVGASVSAKSYIRKGNAERVAKKRYDAARGDLTFTWVVSETNPFVDSYIFSVL